MLSRAYIFSFCTWYFHLLGCGNSKAKFLSTFHCIPPCLEDTHALKGSMHDCFCLYLCLCQSVSVFTWCHSNHVVSLDKRILSNFDNFSCLAHQYGCYVYRLLCLLWKRSMSVTKCKEIISVLKSRWKSRKFANKKVSRF